MGKEKGEKRGKEKKNQDVEELRQKGGKRFISPVRCWGGIIILEKEGWWKG